MANSIQKRFRQARHRSTCLTRKIQYTSQRQANHALQLAWEETWIELDRAYHCPLCRRWHLTSEPKRQAA